MSAPWLLGRIVTPYRESFALVRVHDDVDHRCRCATCRSLGRCMTLSRRDPCDLCVAGDHRPARRPRGIA